MISSSSVAMKNKLSFITHGCCRSSCCRQEGATFRRRVFQTTSSSSNTCPFRLQYRTFQSTTVALEPAPIVWTTHRLSPEQILKVDKLFHKILWLDFMEAALLTECLNKKMGIQLTAQQRRQIEKAVHEKELAEDGSTGESESTEAAETPVETGPKLFDLKLAAFDAKAKIKVIKEVRSILGLGLKEAKELVESAPVNLQKGVKEADAEAFKAKLQEAGATIELVPST